MSARTVFVLGATGYIGGSVLVACLKRYPTFSFTALVRNPKDIAAIEGLGSNVKVLVGSHADIPLIETISADHDVILNLADSDDLPLTNAILKGLSERAKGSATKPILIHTSGTGVVADAPEGTYHPGVKIYDDNVVDDTKSLGPNQPHRQVDLAIIAASEAGVIDAYIVAPSTIYGKGRGPVRHTSIQVNAMIRVAAEHKEVLMVGPGTNIWNNVYIDDLTELYGLIFDFALSGKNTNKGFANYFWGSTVEFTWGEVARSLAKRMYAKGLVKSDKPRSIPVSEAPGYLGYTAPNSRTLSNRGFALGWNPTGPSLEDALDEEIELTVSQL